MTAHRIETRSDIYKLCQAFRRPSRVDVATIGVWQRVLEVMSVLAVLCNCVFLCMLVLQWHGASTSAGAAPLPRPFVSAIANVCMSSASVAAAGASLGRPVVELLVMLGALILIEHLVLGAKVVLAEVIDGVLATRVQPCSMLISLLLIL